MKIGIDIMGGDFAPKATTLGAILALKEVPSDCRIVLIGDEPITKSILAENGVDASLFDFVHADQVIEMGEHPTRALSQKPNSSLSIGFQMLKEGTIDAFASAGNSGAMLVGSMFSVKAIPGMSRPAICSYLPKENGGFGVILDVGANADCKPELLVQFAVLGSLVSEILFGIKNPKVGLLNIGEEAEKGNILTQATYPLLKETANINFIGNIEGRDLFNDKADVIVCDGFTGNIVLKLSETFHDMTAGKGMEAPFFARLNYENYGGSPVLGVNAPVVVGHGISNDIAIKNLILLAKEMVSTNLTEKIKAAFN
ncbi:MAG: phosphate acyltransferase PlsX [Bacteroidota bacterium]|jgi:glycerol-3-phosphate acyltransferase PlsX